MAKDPELAPKIGNKLEAERVIVSLYLSTEMTITQIVSGCVVSKATIYRILEKHDIPRTRRKNNVLHQI